MRGPRDPLRLGRYSFGAGDRFGLQGAAQLRAFIEARALGAEATPVWNKSHREHSIIGSTPPDTRAAADAAVQAAGWNGPYHVDADHVGMSNVDMFIEACDFFTLDVADNIGPAGAEDEAAAFARRHRELAGRHVAPDLDEPLELTHADVEEAARRYLRAAREAGRIYRRIEERKGAGRFITEVSMDETDRPQTPGELLVILAALAEEGVPAQTIAPRFPGRFNKGVDYAGDPALFENEFRRHLAAIGIAVSLYDLPRDLKISVHSGSDKFSLYPAIRRALRRTGAGIHLKTAGTTWLEELTGLAESGGEGLEAAKHIYAEAWRGRQEIIRPYAAVVDIDPARLPDPAEVNGWSAARFADALRHDPTCPSFNPHFRQLLHVSYGKAARMGERYSDVVRRFADRIARNVTFNLLERHIKPILFYG